MNNEGPSKIRLEISVVPGGSQHVMLVSPTVSPEELTLQIRRKIRAKGKAPSSACFFSDDGQLITDFRSCGEKIIFSPTGTAPTPAKNSGKKKTLRERFRQLKGLVEPIWSLEKLPNVTDDAQILAVLKLFPCPDETPHRPSHIWWTPQFRNEHSFLVPPVLRNDLARLISASRDETFVIECRRGVFVLHFDFDIVTETEEDVTEFWNRKRTALLGLLTTEERGAFFVSGFSGPWRGQHKIGIHLYCPNVLVAEKGLQTRIVQLMESLRQLGDPQLPYNCVDSMSGGGLRSLGSSRRVTCSKCRKFKKTDPNCNYCFGQGLEPARVHQIIETFNVGEETCSLFPRADPEQRHRHHLGLDNDEELERLLLSGESADVRAFVPSINFDLVAKRILTHE